MYELPDLDEWEAVLEGIPGVKTLGGTLEYAQVARTKPALDALFVMPARDDAGDESDSEFNRLAIRSRVAVVICTKSDARAGGKSKRLKQLRQDVLNRLHGFQPNKAFKPVRYVSGSLTAFYRDDHSVAWTEIYAAEYWT